MGDRSSQRKSNSTPEARPRSSFWGWSQAARSMEVPLKWQMSLTAERPSTEAATAGGEPARGVQSGTAARMVDISDNEDTMAMIAIIGRVDLSMGFSGGGLRGVGFGFPPLPVAHSQLEGVHEVGA